VRQERADLGCWKSVVGKRLRDNILPVNLPPTFIPNFSIFFASDQKQTHRGGSKNFPVQRQVSACYLLPVKRMFGLGQGLYL